MGTVVERTSARALAARLARDDDADLRDTGWHLRLLQWREQHVLGGLARRLRRAGAGNAFEVFNAAQDHVLLAARAHVERVVLEAFVAAIAACPDPGVGALLRRVCALHALAGIEADRGYYLEHGRLGARRAKAVTSAVNELCRELRPSALTLVDGFGIPDEWLGAPIATGAATARGLSTEVTT